MAVPERIWARLGHLSRKDISEIQKEVAAALYDAAKEELIFTTDCTPDEAAEFLGTHPDGDTK